MTTGDRKETVGFIGIGKMGLPMASRIAAQDYPLHVYDISEAAQILGGRRGETGRRRRPHRDIPHARQVAQRLSRG